jgi:hypothetical protein
LWKGQSFFGGEAVLFRELVEVEVKFEDVDAGFAEEA